MICEVCKHEGDFSPLKQDVANIKNEILTLKDEVKELYRIDAERNGDIRELLLEVKYIKDNVNSLVIKVDELSNKPSKRWDLVVAVVLSSFIGGIATVIVNNLLK